MKVSNKNRSRWARHNFNELLVPKVAKFFRTIPSTNTALLEAIRSNAELPAGTVFLTYAQTDGRGQSTNRWHATPGDNLTLSILLRPDRLSANRLFALNQYVSLAVADALRAFLPPHQRTLIRVKWPNDVYLSQRKIAGILIQNSLQGSHVHTVVVGIGININEAEWPAELAERATSLYRATGDLVATEDVAGRLFECLSEWYTLLANGNYRELDRRYHARLYRIHTPARYCSLADGRTFTATIEGVNRQGQLLLREQSGRLAEYALREIKYV